MWDELVKGTSSAQGSEAEWITGGEDRSLALATGNGPSTTSGLAHHAAGTEAVLSKHILHVRPTPGLQRTQT